MKDSCPAASGCDDGGGGELEADWAATDGVWTEFRSCQLHIELGVQPGRVGWLGKEVDGLPTSNFQLPADRFISPQIVDH